MNNKLYTINEVVKWYSDNADTEISDDFIIYMIKIGLIKPEEMSLYSLELINSFLLKCDYGYFKKNELGKYEVRDNRKELLKKYPKKQTRTPKRFKIASLDGNKLKLIKLN